MQTRWHLVGIVIACIISWLSLAIIVTMSNPADTSALIRVLFFLSVLIAVWTLVALAIYGIRAKIQGKDADAILLPSLVQAFFAVVIGMLVILIKHLI